MAISWQVLVIDEVMATREGVAIILNRHLDVELVGLCSSVDEAVTELESNRFNLVFINFQAGQNKGIEIGHTLLEASPALKIIIYTSGSSRVFAAEVYRYEFQNLLQSGTNGSFIIMAQDPQNGSMTPVTLSLHGYTLLQNITPVNLEKNLARLNTTGNFIDQDILMLLLNKLNQPRLTPRELQCCELISRGKSNVEVAEHLGITRPAIENLNNSLYHKLSIKGEPKDSSRRVRLALEILRWRGLD